MIPPGRVSWHWSPRRQGGKDLPKEMNATQFWAITPETTKGKILKFPPKPLRPARRSQDDRHQSRPDNPANFLSAGGEIAVKHSEHMKTEICQTNGNQSKRWASAS